MSLRICTSEWMISDLHGTGLAAAWLPRVVAQRFAPSGRDGQVAQAPDPVPMIDTDLIWTNQTGADQDCHLQVHRASRSIVTSSPNTIILEDAVSWDIALSPSAPLPSPTAKGIGARIKASPTLVTDVKYGRVFNDWDDCVTTERLGTATAGETVQVRYQCLVSTPGEWRAATSPLFQAHARWVRLRLVAAPLP